MSTWVQTQPDQQKAVNEYNAYMMGRGGELEEEFQEEMNKILHDSIFEYREVNFEEGQRIIALENHPRFKAHRDKLRELVFNLRVEDAKAVKRAASRNEIFGVPAPGILQIDHDLPLSPHYKKPKSVFSYNGGATNFNQ